MKNLTTRLDTLASHLESLGMVKEAHDLDVVSNSIEAGMGQWFKSLLTRIPGLPTKEQALKIVAPVIERNPRGFEQAVSEISAVLQSAGKEQFYTRLALDMSSLVRSIKTLTDPKVILAIIALMGAFQTADAGALRDRIRSGDQKQEQEQAPKANNQWVNEFVKKVGGLDSIGLGKNGTVKVGDTLYAVGASTMGKNDRDPNFAMGIADRGAVKAADRANYSDTDVAQRELFGNTIFSAIKLTHQYGTP